MTTDKETLTAADVATVTAEEILGEPPKKAAPEPPAPPQIVFHEILCEDCPTVVGKRGLPPGVEPPPQKSSGLICESCATKRQAAELMAAAGELEPMAGTAADFAPTTPPADITPPKPTSSSRKKR